MAKVQRNARALARFFEILQAELQTLSSPMPWKQAMLDRQRQRMRKRSLIPVQGLDDKAVDEFITLNDSLRGFSHGLSQTEVSYARTFIRFALEKAHRLVDPDDVQGTLDLAYLFDNWRYGPGASNGARGSHAVEKIVQVMTTTKRCKPYVDQLRWMSPYFRAKDGAFGAGSSLIYGSRLATVPKNETTMRTIAIEPLGNMVLQLAAGRLVEDALRCIGLDITSQQPKNKRLAKIGSTDYSLATIDLKSASDRVTPSLIRALWPREWARLLADLRSPTILTDRGHVELNMVSTMGNGFTFPVMTLTLLALVMTNRCIRGGSLTWVDYEKTAVFGDDIIVPTEEYSSLCELIERAGFVVNHDKSYSSGAFRESCGGDYWEGVDITPFYVKSLSSDAEVYVAINQVLSWCAKGNVFLPSTLSYLVDLVTTPLFVPEWLNPDQGIQVALVARKYKYLRSKPVRVRAKGDSFSHYAVMLACGGYLEQGNKDHDLLYSPRREALRYSVANGSLPKGWESGWDPSKRSGPESEHVIQQLRMIS